jgi:hypothetical protein
MHAIWHRCAREQRAEIVRLVAGPQTQSRATGSSSVATVASPVLPSVETEESTCRVGARYRLHEFVQREVQRLAPLAVSWLESGMPAGARGSAGEVPWTEVLVEDGNLLAAHDEGAAGKQAPVRRLCRFFEAAWHCAHRCRVLNTQTPPYTSMNNLANAYTALGDYGHAAALHVIVLALYKRMMGADHPTSP